jgi:hypothetical protein
MRVCQHCGVRKAARGKRGLCVSCYVTPEIRAAHPSTSKYCPGKFPKELVPLLGIETDSALARRVGVRRAAVWALRVRLGISAATARIVPAAAGSADDEPTAEEVERTVAEQRACLPDWWDSETGKD